MTRPFFHSQNGETYSQWNIPYSHESPVDRTGLVLLELPKIDKHTWQGTCLPMISEPHKQPSLTTGPAIPGWPGMPGFPSSPCIKWRQRIIKPHQTAKQKREVFCHLTSGPLLPRGPGGPGFPLSPYSTQDEKRRRVREKEQCLLAWIQWNTSATNPDSFQAPWSCLPRRALTIEGDNKQRLAEINPPKIPANTICLPSIQDCQLLQEAPFDLWVPNN